MPSFFNHYRNYSWPPSVEDYGSSDEDELPDIDDDPFAHFLTPVNEEDDPYDALSFSAGIIATDNAPSKKSSKFRNSVAKKWARYVARHHEELHELYHEQKPDGDDNEGYIIELDDARLLEMPRTQSILSTSKNAAEPTRERTQELLRPSRGRRRSRRTSRTLSGHRHSWREPSPDLFTVMETEEVEHATTKTKTKTKDGEERRRSNAGEVVEKAKL
ncbi:hypothetical protein K432DRAFT_286449 [Lepidopterella palustris CBS 459.81]|uniref:Uncharacterized protein n=1 Tax=Lepidopterella palustris CBS 459.81 TaxID=1314670 RepID=A0A8E2JKA6_9PEZI|nr:hypothetical protein K432DRAFT_286449 [Lepidopterella palustris CBS 459.81]